MTSKHSVTKPKNVQHEGKAQSVRNLAPLIRERPQQKHMGIARKDISVEEMFVVALSILAF